MADDEHESEAMIALGKHSTHDCTASVLRWSWDGFGVALAGTVATVLICFVITTPLCTLGIPFPPEIRTGGVVHFTPQDLHVVVGREGVAYVANDEVRSDGTFEATVESAVASGRYRTVVVEADRHVAFRALTPIFRAVQRRRLSLRLVGAETSLLQQSVSEPSALARR